jgi:glycosyltransferase involved in cell wall biosynthesis
VRIAVDARELHGKRTGVGRYLAEILAEWKELPAARAHEVILLAPSESDVASGFSRKGHGGTLWEQFTLPGLVRQAAADVLFAPGYTGPLRCPVPMVLTIHDVSFAAHPEWFRWREGLRRRALTRLSARRATRVLTVSEFSKREIARELGVAPAKIEAIYSGVTSSLYPVGRALSRSPLVLYVGSIFNRRHVPELIDGFARMARRRPDVHLEIVGDDRTTPPVAVAPLIRATGISDRIRVRDYVSDDELASLYGRARAFAFLSEYEGFGLTPLEALGAGIPIVVLDTPIAREIYGEAAVYVSRPDPALIEAALEQTLFDNGVRQRLLAAAKELLPRYSWRDCAAKVLRALESARHE